MQIQKQFAEANYKLRNKLYLLDLMMLFPNGINA